MIGRVLLWGLALVGVGAAAVVVIGYVLYAGARTSTVGKLAFANELAIPPLLEPVHGRGGGVLLSNQAW